MGKIANISLCATSEVGFPKIASSTFFNIFAWNLQDMRKSAFPTQIGGRFLIEASEKNPPHFKCEMQFYKNPERL